MRVATLTCFLFLVVIVCSTFSAQAQESNTVWNIVL